MIARPTFIFGSVASPSDPARDGDVINIEPGSPAKRLGAVG